MRVCAADFKFVEHPVFGRGVVFGNRITDSGPVSDAWFADGEKTRTVLSETLADSAKLELPAAQRKALRAASAEYRKSHKQRAKRTTAYKPRLKKQFRDRIHRAEFRHISGDEPGAADEAEHLAADVTP